MSAAATPPAPAPGRECLGNDVPDGLVGASNLSLHICAHGSVTFRLHAADGRLYAFGSMQRDNALEVAADIVRTSGMTPDQFAAHMLRSVH